MAAPSRGSVSAAISSMSARVPGVAELETLSAQFGRASVEVVGEPTARGSLVEHGDDLHVVLERRRAPPDGARKLMEDALLLLQRAGFGDGELVAELHQLL